MPMRFRAPAPAPCGGFTCYIGGPMGRQWLHAKRLVAGLKKGKTNSKLVREITLAAKIGGADPVMNARLFAAIEKAKKESVPKDAIQRSEERRVGKECRTRRSPEN